MVKTDKRTLIRLLDAVDAARNVCDHTDYCSYAGDLHWYELAIRLRITVARNALLTKEFDVVPDRTTITSLALAPKKVGDSFTNIDHGKVDDYGRCIAKINKPVDEEEEISELIENELPSNNNLFYELVYGYVKTSRHWGAFSEVLPSGWEELISEEEKLECIDGVFSSLPAVVRAFNLCPDADPADADQREVANRALFRVLSKKMPERWARRHIEDYAEWLSLTPVGNMFNYTDYRDYEASGELIVLYNDQIVPFLAWFDHINVETLPDFEKRLIDAIMWAIDIVNNPLERAMRDFTRCAEIDKCTGIFSSWFAFGGGEAMYNSNFPRVGIMDIVCDMQLAERVVEAGIIWLDRKYKLMGAFVPQKEGPSVLDGVLIYSGTDRRFVELSSR